MTVEHDFEGKIAVVTGAGRGIGAVTARVPAQRGARVALVDRTEGGIQNVAAAIEQEGGRSAYFRADVSNEEEVGGAFAAINGTFGGVDVLIANHTVHACGPVLDTSLAEWDLSLAINLTGTFLCARAAIPSMIERGGGAIVGLGSDCVVRSCRNSGAYMASKGAIIGLIRSIAIDYAANNIRANVVVPGATDTPGLREVFGDRGNLDESVVRAATQSPFGRLGRAEDVAEMIAFACSERASFVTGTELLVEGGMTLNYAAD